MGILDTAGDVSSILAAMEKARADGRLAQGDAQQRQANAAANIYRTQADVALKGPEQSARAAALGDQMANIQPFQWTGATQQIGNIPVPQSTGGLTPANFGPATRKAGSDLANLSADRVSSPSFNMPNAPILPPLPESSGLDSILGTAGSVGSLLSALGKNSSGSSLPIQKLIDAIRNRGKPTSGNTGQPTGEFGDWLNDPGNGPNGNTGQPTGEFGDWLNDPGNGPETGGQASAGGERLPGVGDGNGYYDENGKYIDLTDWQQGNSADGAGSDGSNGTWWGDE